ncbi:MAG: LysR family transcriptional regulator [Polyangiaceae bacterium]
MARVRGSRPAPLRLQQINLNLLIALEAILTEGSVTGAARRLGVTQSAMSHSLAQLRALLKDPILVRARGSHKLTLTAEHLVVPVRRTLHEIERVLGGAPDFDPATSEQSYSIAAGDFVSVTLGREVLALLEHEAPHAKLSLRVPDARRMVAELESGDVDLHVVVRAPDSPGLRQRKLFDETFACVVRKGHPALARGLDLLTFTELPHALVTPQGEGPSLVDDLLARQGLKRKIVLRIPYFLAAPMLVASRDLVLTLPRSAAELLAQRFGLSVLEPPLPLPGFSLQMVWHERFDGDASHVWFRELVQRAAARLAST